MAPLPLLVTHCLMDIFSIRFFLFSQYSGSPDSSKYPNSAWKPHKPLRCLQTLYEKILNLLARPLLPKVACWFFLATRRRGWYGMAWQSTAKPPVCNQRQGISSDVWFRRSGDAVCSPGRALGSILGGIMRVIREPYLMQQHQGEQGCCRWETCCSVGLLFWLLWHFFSVVLIANHLNSAFFGLALSYL